MGFRERFWRSRESAIGVALGLAAVALAGCSPQIGDRCVLNTDCGSSGSLVCDTSLPYGYCTQFNCTTNSCQNSAACVAFEPSVPGCPYDDYLSPGRTARTFCMKSCQRDSDCRQSDGYICADPRLPPWNAAIIDDTPQMVCIPGYSGEPPDAAATALPPGSVCSPSGPVFEAGEDSSPGPAQNDAGDAAGADAPAPDSAPADAASDDSGDAGVADAQDALDEG
jgi:hypothetical protein